MNRPRSSDLAGGLHPLWTGHEHPGTGHPFKSRNVRYKSALLHVALDSVLERYEKHLSDVELEDLHDAVLHELRPALKAEWDQKDAVQYALEIATRVRGAPPTEDAP